MFIDFIDEGKEREKHGYDRNIDWLPPVNTVTGEQTRNLVCALTRDGTHNLFFFFGIQANAPTDWNEPPGQGTTVILKLDNYQH